jgi:hypothetical protein
MIYLAEPRWDRFLGWFLVGMGGYNYELFYANKTSQNRVKWGKSGSASALYFQ